MADPLIPYLNRDAPPGEKLAPEMRAEIAEVAPSVVVNNSITTAKLRDKAVTGEKMADGAVGSPQIAQGGVKTINIDDQAVTTDKLNDGSVTAAKAGIGVSKAVDADDEPIENTFKFVTAAEFAGMTQVPGVTYMVGP
ncbi:hypothetical protein SEA_SEJANUS_35 [Mycobacterium phage Sejanus]|nr:hypothetical protein SEA_SEJANUS_35 [Mycobacterium phage Sejanus]